MIGGQRERQESYFSPSLPSLWVIPKVICQTGTWAEHVEKIHDTSVFCVDLPQVSNIISLKYFCTSYLDFVTEIRVSKISLILEEADKEYQSSCQNLK